MGRGRCCGTRAQGPQQRAPREAMAPEDIANFVQQVQAQLAGAQQQMQVAAQMAQAAASTGSVHKQTDLAEKWSRNFGSADLDADTQQWPEYNLLG